MEKPRLGWYRVCAGKSSTAGCSKPEKEEIRHNIQGKGKGKETQISHFSKEKGNQAAEWAAVRERYSPSIGVSCMPGTPL
jgi:hypothetical protein